MHSEQELLLEALQTNRPNEGIWNFWKNNLRLSWAKLSKSLDELLAREIFQLIWGLVTNLYFVWRYSYEILNLNLPFFMICCAAKTFSGSFREMFCLFLLNLAILGDWEWKIYWTYMDSSLLLHIIFSVRKLSRPITWPVPLLFVLNCIAFYFFAEAAPLSAILTGLQSLTTKVLEDEDTEHSVAENNDKG